MIKLAEHKERTKERSIERLSAPAKAYIHLSQHIGKPCSPQVQPGDTVLLGQRIGACQAQVYAPVHASVSGRVLAIQDWPHPVAGRGRAVVIENDGKDSRVNLASRTQEEVDSLSIDEIRRAIFEAGIVGLGGAGFPSHLKLAPPKPVDTLIVNAAECEPGLTGDYRLMLEHTDGILKGARLACRAAGASRIYLAIEDNKPDAIEAFRAREAKAGFQLKVLRSSYPQGGEKQLTRSVLGREVPRGKLPFDIGVVVHNVATLYAMYEAVYLAKPLYERVVTVTGSCLANPKNLLVRIGTPIRELIDSCGPLKEGPAKIITGGPMMGIAQYTQDVPVIKSTTGVVLMGKSEAASLEEEYCIRCGACVRECPVQVMPCLINLASERENWQLARAYGAPDCIECGVCSYVCPANRRLVQSIKRAKMELLK